MALACQLPPSEYAISRMHDVAQRLASSRPSMAALANTVARIWRAGFADPDTQYPLTRLRRMDDEARFLQRYWDDVDPDLIRHAAPLLAGALYTHSRSGTVEAVLRALSPVPDDPARVVVAESRPGGEGVALAKALATAGWEVTLVADAACGLFVPTVDAVVIGADSVRSDGAVVNKIGSYPLALVARASGKPFYVVCESLKITPVELPLTLERLPASTSAGGNMSEVQLDTVAFDVTPPQLITGVVTELGPLDRQDIARLAGDASDAYRALVGDVATAAGEG